MVLQTEEKTKQREAKSYSLLFETIAEIFTYKWNKKNEKERKIKLINHNVQYLMINYAKSHTNQKKL